ncbi:MAG: hypothetical protein KatS3mg014_2442 [Actinomycetota bacterium]|nr:MAG: hypothetical protein KatS3mg014_2442 [Actinomycetota bacterium]
MSGPADGPDAAAACQLSMFSAEDSPARTSRWLDLVSDWLANGRDWSGSSFVSLTRSLPHGFSSGPLALAVNQRHEVRTSTVSPACAGGKPGQGNPVVVWPARTAPVTKPDRGVAHERPIVIEVLQDPVTAEVPPTVATAGNLAVLTRSVIRRLTPRECERLQGFPDDWTAGLPDTTRYRLIGNAVTVPVVAWIARRLVAVHRGEAP